MSLVNAIVSSFSCVRTDLGIDQVKYLETPPILRNSSESLSSANSAGFGLSTSQKKIRHLTVTSGSPASIDEKNGTKTESNSKRNSEEEKSGLIIITTPPTKKENISPRTTLLINGNSTELEETKKQTEPEENNSTKKRHPRRRAKGERRKSLEEKQTQETGHVRHNSDSSTLDFTFVHDSKKRRSFHHRRSSSSSTYDLSDVFTEVNEDVMKSQNFGDSDSFEDFELLHKQIEEEVDKERETSELPKETEFGFELTIPPGYQRKFLCRSEKDRESWVGVINFYSLGKPLLF